MKFVESNVILGNKGLYGGSKVVAQMLSEFLESGIEVAEVRDYDEYYKNSESAYQSIKNIIDRYFTGEIRVARQSDHVFIARLEK